MLYSSGMNDVYLFKYIVGGIQCPHFPTPNLIWFSEKTFDAALYWLILNSIWLYIMLHLVWNGTPYKIRLKNATQTPPHDC